MNPFDNLVTARLIDQSRHNRFSARRKLCDNGNVQIGIESHGQRSGNRCRTHHQLVRDDRTGIFPLVSQHKPLSDTETVLLVDNSQPQIGKTDAVLNQGMCPDNKLCLPRLD